MADQQLTITIRGQSQEAVRAIKDASVAMGQLVGASVEMEKGLTRSAATAETRLASLARRSADVETAVRGMATGVAVAAAPMVAAIKVAVDYDKALRSVDSIAKLTPAALQALGKEVIALSRDPNIAQGPTQLAEGLYQIYSSGQQGAEALETLKVAAMGATAGMTDTETAAKVLLAVMNSGIGGVNNQKEAMDVLFKTVEVGQVTFEELASTIGSVLPTAKNAGISLQEVGAAIATMTIHGQSASEATNDLLNLITKIIRPPAEAEAIFKKLGISYGVAAFQGKGLGGVLEEIATKTRGNSQALQDLFPDMQASRGSSSLLTEAGVTFGQSLDGTMKATKGLGASTEALNRVLPSTAVKFEQAKAATEALGIELGSKLLPQLNSVLDIMAKHPEVAAFAIQVGVLTYAFKQLLEVLTALQSLGVLKLLTSGAGGAASWLAGGGAALAIPGAVAGLGMASGLATLHPETQKRLEDQREANAEANRTALRESLRQSLGLSKGPSDLRALQQSFGMVGGESLTQKRTPEELAKLFGWARPGGKAKGDPVPVLPPLTEFGRSAAIKAVSDEDAQAIASVREQYFKLREKLYQSKDPGDKANFATIKQNLATAEEQEVNKILERAADQREQAARAETDRKVQELERRRAKIRTELEAESREALSIQERGLRLRLLELEEGYRASGKMSREEIERQLAADKVALMKQFTDPRNGVDQPVVGPPAPGRSQYDLLGADQRERFDYDLAFAEAASRQAERLHQADLRKGLSTALGTASRGLSEAAAMDSELQDQITAGLTAQAEKQKGLKREIVDLDFQIALALAQQAESADFQLSVLELQVARRQEEQAALGTGLEDQKKRAQLELEISGLLAQQKQVTAETAEKQEAARAALRAQISDLQTIVNLQEELGQRQAAAGEQEARLRRALAERAGGSALRDYLARELAVARAEIEKLGTPYEADTEGRGKLVKLHLDVMDFEEQLSKLEPKWKRYWSDLADQAKESLRSIGENAFEGLFENLLGGKKQDVFKQLIDDLRSMAAQSLSRGLMGGLEGLFRGGGGLFGGIFLGGGRRGTPREGDPDFVGPPAPGRVGGTGADLTQPTKQISMAVPQIALGLAGLVMTLRKGKTDLTTTLLQLASVILSVVSMIPGGFGGIGSFFSGLFADGGDPPVGKVAIVGERGPELFVPRTSGTIIPNHRIRLGMPSGSGQGPVVSGQFGGGAGMGAAGNIRQVVREIVAELAQPQVNVTQNNTGPIHSGVDLERSARELGWAIEQRLRTA